MKKIIALMLSAAMVLCMMPSMAFAADVQGSSTTQEEPESKTQLTADMIKGVVDKPYTGGEVIQTITIGEETITGTNDNFTVTYSRTDSKRGGAANINAGTVTLTVTATDANPKYSGSASKDFRITPVSLDSCTAQDIPDQEIGSAPDDSLVKLNYKGNTLKQGTDYTIKSKPDKTTVGGNQIVVEAVKDGNFTGTKFVNYRGANLITSANFQVEVVGTIKEQTYSGNPLTVPSSYFKVTSKKDNSPLSTNYYTVSFENNVNVTDSPTAVITGTNDYSGTLKLENVFKIVPKNINSCNISYPENVIEGEDPEITIKDGSKVLVKDRDYYFGDVSNKSIPVIGVGNYGGEKLLSVNYGDSIKAAVVSLYPDSFEYTGYAIRPTTYYVNLAGKLLRENVDYKVVYEKNTDIGTANMKIIGIGKYAGTVTKTFQIRAKSINGTDTRVSMTDSFIYTGKAIEPAVTVTCGSRTLVKGKDYTVHYYNNNKIGTGSVSIIGTGNYTGIISKSFKILGKDIGTLTAGLSSYKYNYTGLEHKPSVTLYDGSKKLYSGTDYTVAYKDNKNCGTASVVLTGKGNYSGTKTVTFQIVGKDQTITTNYTYYTKYTNSKAFSLNGKTDGDGTLTYRSSNPEVAQVSASGTVTITGTGKATITVASKNDVKYTPAQKNVYVEVKPLKPVIKVTSPAKKQVKVTITKVKGATKYQVKYGRNGVYYNKYITHRDNGYKQVYTIIKNRISGKTYDIKVRAYKTLEDGTKVWGNWTSVKKIKSK